MIKFLRFQMGLDAECFEAIQDLREIETAVPEATYLIDNFEAGEIPTFEFLNRADELLSHPVI